MPNCEFSILGRNCLPYLYFFQISWNLFMQTFWTIWGHIYPYFILKREVVLDRIWNFGQLENAHEIVLFLTKNAKLTPCRLNKRRVFFKCSWSVSLHSSSKRCGCIYPYLKKKKKEKIYPIMNFQFSTKKCWTNLLDAFVKKNSLSNFLWNYIHAPFFDNRMVFTLIR